MRRRHTGSLSAPELQVALFRVRVADTRLGPETLPALEDAVCQIVFLRRGTRDIIAVAQYLREDRRRKRGSLNAMLLDETSTKINMPQLGQGREI